MIHAKILPENYLRGSRVQYYLGKIFAWIIGPYLRGGNMLVHNA